MQTKLVKSFTESLFVIIAYSGTLIVITKLFRNYKTLIDRYTFAKFKYDRS